MGGDPVLEQDRITAHLRVEEVGAGGVVEEQHHRAGDERADREHEDDARGDLFPHKQRHVPHAHAGRAQVDRGRDEVDAPHQERDQLERDREDPQGDAPVDTGVRHVGRERGVAGPPAGRAAAGHDRREQEHHRREEEHPVRSHVQLREGHVLGADHQRDQQVAEAGDQDRHGDPEDHDGAVHGHGRVVDLRIEEAPEAAGLHARELRADRRGGGAAEQRHDQAGDHVLLGDHLVIGGEDVLRDEALGVGGVAHRPVRIRGWRGRSGRRRSSRPRAWRS